MAEKSSPGFLSQLNILRGLASLAVCIYHSTLGNRDFIPAESIAEQTAKFGYLGVEVFFVLSGFVVCWSLPENYTYRLAGKFYLKRLIRIEPVYLTAVLLVVVLHTASGLARNEPYIFSWLNVAAHIAYLPGFGIGTYLNVVFWTLGIEFQFYLLIGLLFPLLIKSAKNKLHLFILLFALSFLSLIHSRSILLLSNYWGLFMLGICTFLYFRKYLALKPYLLLLLVQVVFSYVFLDIAAVVAGVLSVFVIFFISGSNAIFDYLAKISYSLYLVHVPVGGKVINLFTRFDLELTEKYLVVLLAIAVSCAAATVFYYLVEVPFLRLSKKKHYAR